MRNHRLKLSWVLELTHYLPDERWCDNQRYFWVTVIKLYWMADFFLWSWLLSRNMEDAKEVALVLQRDNFLSMLRQSEWMKKHWELEKEATTRGSQACSWIVRLWSFGSKVQGSILSRLWKYIFSPGNFSQRVGSLISEHPWKKYRLKTSPQISDS